MPWMGNATSYLSFPDAHVLLKHFLTPRQSCVTAGGADQAWMCYEVIRPTASFEASYCLT